MLLNKAVFARLLSVFCMFWIQAVLARLLTTSEFGILQIVFSYSYLFAYISTLGIPFFMLKILPAESFGQENLQSQILFRGLKLSAAASLAVALLLLATEYVGGGFMAKLLRAEESQVLLIGVYFVLFSINYAISEVCRGFGRVILANYVIGFGLMGFSALLLTGLLVNHSSIVLSVVLGVLVFSSVLTLVISLFRLRTSLTSSLRGEWKSERQIIWQAVPFFLNLLIVYSLSQIDLWIVFYAGSASQAGFYSQVVKLVQVFSIYQTAILATVPSLVVPAMMQRRYDEVREVNRRIGMASLCTAIVPCLLYYFWGGDILNLVFRSNSPEQVSALWVLAGGATLALAMGPQGFVLSLVGQIQRVNVLQFLSLVIFFVIAFCLPEIKLVHIALLTVSLGLVNQLVFRFWLGRLGKT